MSRIVLLRAASGPAVGIGHAMRSRAVAWALREAGARPLLIVDDERTAQLLAADGFEVDEHGERRHWTRRSAAAAWLDGFGDWRAELEELRARDTRTFVVEKRGSARDLADGVVYPALHWRADRWDETHAERVLGGAGWIPLAPEVERCRPRPRDVELLVTFGGSDPLCSTERVLRLLRIDGPVVVVVGPHMAARRDAIAHAGAHLPGLQVLQVRGSLASWMARARRAVTALGTTLYELAYLGVPAAILANYEDDREALEHYAEHGPHRPLGGATQLADDELEERLARFAEEPPAPFEALAGGGAARLARVLLGRETVRESA